MGVMKIGETTGWLRTIGQTEAAGLPVSSHLFPEISAIKGIASSPVIAPEDTFLTKVIGFRAGTKP